MRWLFSPKALIVGSCLMMLAGLSLDALVWLHLIAKNEPRLVLHLSTWALIFSAYGNILMAKVNKEVKK